MGNTYAKKSAAGGGITGKAKRVTKAGSGGKMVGANKAPLPKQKKASGSGIAGRGTRG